MFEWKKTGFQETCNPPPKFFHLKSELNKPSVRLSLKI